MDKHDELALKIARETHIIGHTFAPVSDDVINFARRLRAKWEKEQLTWKEAVLNELIVCHIYNSSHDNDPRKAVQDAITCNCQVALDPTVSSEAQALIDRGAVESRAEIALDTARLDYLQNNAICDLKMDVQYVWWPINFNQRLAGQNIREALDAAIAARTEGGVRW